MTHRYSIFFSVLIALILISLSIWLTHPVIAAELYPPISPATDKAGKAVERGDFKTALELLKPLAEKGDPNAQVMLGLLYDEGKGVAQNLSVAASWYQKAAEQKHLVAQVLLGDMYYSGQGVKRDYKKAARWFQAPADNGDGRAQFYLGKMYADGEGFKKDESKAIHWLTKSAEQKHTRAMGMLAVLLFSRKRDDQDMIDAYIWSHLAAEYDPIQRSTTSRMLIEKYCNDEQKKKGEKGVAEWKKKWSGDTK